MRHLLKGAWFYMAQLTVDWTTLNKNINTGGETWSPCGAPDQNACWINSNLAPCSLRWSKQDLLKAAGKSRPSLCVNSLKVLCSIVLSTNSNFMPPSRPDHTKLLPTWPGDLNPFLPLKGNHYQRTHIKATLRSI